MFGDFFEEMTLIDLFVFSFVFLHGILYQNQKEKFLDQNPTFIIFNFKKIG